MKKMIVVLMVLITLMSCQMGMVPDVESGFSLATGDSGAVNSRDLSASLSSKTVSAPNGVKVSFRSSDIEFWATGGNYTNLKSNKFRYKSDVNIDEFESGNISTSIKLSDAEDNVMFIPNHVKLSDYDMPEFGQEVYDVARMDIGSGQISYTMNGNTLSVSNSKLDSGNLYANSIVFIDESVLNKIVYISDNRDHSNYGEMSNIYYYYEYAVGNGLDPYDFIANGNSDYPALYGPGGYFSDKEFDDNMKFVVDFIYHNFSFIDSGEDSMYNVDMNGALFVPFKPIDITKGNVKKVKIRIDWDLDNIFTEVDSDTATLSDVADGTPYNFNVSVEVN